MVENMNKYEEEMMEKSDQINDFRRQILVLENEIKKLKAQLDQEKTDYQWMKK